MKKILLLICAAFMATTIYAEKTQNWWGYASDNTPKYTLGVKSPDTYHCAIFIPGNSIIAAGKSIKAIRFGLTAPNVENVRVWVAGHLPSEINSGETLQYVDVPNSELGEDIRVTLPIACTVSETGLYVGYSFTITKAATEADQFPVYFTNEEDTPNTLIIKTEQIVPEWSDMSGQGFGRLFLQVLLEGEFTDYSAIAADFGPVYAAIGGTAQAQLAVTNIGSKPISSIDYTITSDGVSGATQHVDIANAITFNSTGTVDITVPADATTGMSPKTLNIVKVNGSPNANADFASEFVLYTLPELVERNVVVEEFTGTGCGWCPRGIIGMEKLRENFGDRFIGIGLHQYNSNDAMYIDPTGYAYLAFPGAPSCALDRGLVIDPYYGSADDICDDFAAEMAIPALAKISVSGTANADMTQVDAKAEVEALLDGSQFGLEFVVVGDGIKGSGAGWNQSNYYSQYSASELPADLAIFGMGGEYGKSSISGWTFNDVALCSSYVNNVNEAPGLGVLAAGQKQESNYTLTLPTKAKLKNAIQKDQLYVVALLTDAFGRIVNAAKAQVTTEGTAVNAINSTDATVVSRYSLDGRQLSTPQKGLNIVKLSDGRTVKVLVK